MNQFNPVDTHIHINIFHFPGSPSHSGINTKNVHFCLLFLLIIISHLYYMPCPSHLLSLYRSNYTFLKGQFIKLFMEQFFPTSCHFISLWFKLPQLPLSNTISLCSYLNFRDQFPNPYRITGKIIDLCNLIFAFSDCRQKVLD
jgi:hypothetical protein